MGAIEDCEDARRCALHSDRKARDSTGEQSVEQRVVDRLGIGLDGDLQIAGNIKSLLDAADDLSEIRGVEQRRCAAAEEEGVDDTIAEFAPGEIKFGEHRG
jgi:hypothetical protein